MSEPETASGLNETVHDTASGLNEPAPETASAPETAPATAPAPETASGLNEPAPATAQEKKCLYCCVEKSLCECYFGGSYFNADGREI